jgi:stage II sporulation protein D
MTGAARAGRVGIVLLAWSSLVFLSAARAEDLVRVLVAEGRPALSLAGGGAFTVTDLSGRQLLADVLKGAEVRLIRQAKGVLVRETRRTAAAVLASPRAGIPIALDGHPFRGRIEVQPLNGALAAINVVELEEYLTGVLKDEIPPGWPTEAAKAMAVAARTYATYQRLQNPAGLFHLRSTTQSQVYGGARGEDSRTTLAVQATRGQILVFNGQPLAAYYHSCSGGSTEAGNEVFGLEFDYLPSVKDDYSLACPYSLWVERLDTAQIEQSLARAGYPVGRIASLQDLSRSRTGRILRVQVQHSQGTLIIDGRRFREALGNDVIRSTDFVIRGDAGGFTFVGRGFGHGVGMSQWGAKEMADLAYHYDEILKFYYPLARIANWQR